MTANFGTTDVERFRAVIERRMGLRFEDAKFGFLGDVLQRRLDATRRDSADYLQHLEGAGSTEVGALAPELTVPETYFYRNIDQFRAFAEHVVPDRVRARGATKRLSVLSAGCATGEEPYTLAILLRETMDPSFQATVLGIDINPVVLERAARARYSPWALRETPPEAQRRWFTPAGRDSVLDDSITAAVRFEQHNLVDDDPRLWEPEKYDVVFCRNVIMYLSPENGQMVVSRIERSLAPGGYLFLGHAETLRGLSQDFHLCHTHGTFYYQSKGHPPGPVRNGSASRPAPRAVESSAPLLSAVADSDTWVDAIRMATERVHSLTESSNGAAPDTTRNAAATQDRWDLAAALELLQQERFAEALGLVEALPLEAGVDPGVLLLRAVLLTHSGLLTRAEEACRQLLALDELSAGAHYLLALCREGAGDLDGAVDHDRTATYLDPGFAMPRLHLGLLARRAGDLTALTRELGLAMTLLQKEDASRLLLFGGGFGREALIGLCRSEMLATGARS